jgi:hypothetical protein
MNLNFNPRQQPGPEQQRIYRITVGRNLDQKLCHVSIAFLSVPVKSIHLEDSIPKGVILTEPLEHAGH